MADGGQAGWLHYFGEGSGIAPALLRHCSGIAQVLLRWVALGWPLNGPWVALGWPVGLLGKFGRSAAVWLGSRSLADGDNHVEPPGDVSPTVQLLLGGDDDPRPGPRHTISLTVQSGEVAHASFAGRQEAEVSQLVAGTPARAARARAEDQYVTDRRLGNAEQEHDPVPGVTGHQGPDRGQSKRRALGWIQVWGQAEKVLVGVYHHEEVLRVQAMTSGQVTTPVFPFGGLVPGTILLLGQRVPQAGGTPKSSPSVVLGEGTAYAALGGIICLHKLVSFVAAA